MSARKKLPSRMTEATDFAPFRDRLMALRCRTLVLMAEQEDGMSDAGLVALVANVQTALVAIEGMIAERQRQHPTDRD